MYRCFAQEPRIVPSNGPLHSTIDNQETSPPHPSPPQPFRLTQAYAVILHVGTGPFFYSVVRLHVYIHGIRESDGLTQLSLGNPTTDFFRPVVVTCNVIASCHCIALFVMLMRALRCRGSEPVKKPQAAKLIVSPTKFLTTRLNASLANRKQGGAMQHRRSKRLFRSLARIVAFVFSKVAYWSERLEKKVGADVHQLEIIIEVLLQTYQAYKMSSLVAVVWVNRLMALVVVANCWFIPLIHVVLRKRPTAQLKIRLLVFDSLLDAVYGMAIPFAVFYPYYMEYDLKTQATPRISAYMDTYTINSTATLRQIFVTSWLDLVSKMSPGFGLLFRLIAIQRLAEKVAKSDRDGVVSSRIESALEFKVRQRTIWKKRLVNLSLFLWGMMVLVMHLTATAVVWVGHDRGCLLEMRPYGSAQYTCAVYEVSCNQKGIRGAKDELDLQLGRVYAHGLQGLIISHCPTLSMPPRLKTFRSLQTIKIHNSTLVNWGLDAALTAESHPTMKSLHFTLINMSGIPDGLRAPGFPSTVYDIQLCGTNLTTLPEDLFSKSRLKVIAFILERSPGITESPRALVSPQTSTWMLSLAGNAIQKLPADTFSRPYYMLFLDRNPIQALPEDAGIAAVAFVLSIGSTEIAGVPAPWFNATKVPMYAAMAKRGFQMAALNTPLCENLLEEREESGGPSSSNSTMLQLDWIRVNCGSSQTDNGYFYPLQDELQWRERNRY